MYTILKCITRSIKVHSKNKPKAEPKPEVVQDTAMAPTSGGFDKEAYEMMKADGIPAAEAARLARGA